MIISKTPFRISFFGGGTDFPEYFNNRKTRVIGTAINKSIYVTNSFFSNEKNIKFKLFYKDVEKVNKVNLIKHKVIRKLFQKIRIKNNLELHFISDLPSFSGLGSSSSFSTGLINLIFFLNKKLVKKNDLARFVINFERNNLKECVGFQDQIFASYGGFNSITFENRKFKVKKYSLNNDIKNIENNSFILHTDLKRKAISIEKKKLNRINKNIKYLDSIKSISEEANKYLEDGNLSKNFSYLLNESWNQKKKLHESVSNKIIEDLYDKAFSQGAIAGKLLGAGNGGYMYFYVPKKNQYNFLKYFKGAIKINFESEGSKIIQI